MCAGDLAKEGGANLWELLWYLIIGLVGPAPPKVEPHAAIPMRGRVGNVKNID